MKSAKLFFQNPSFAPWIVMTALAAGPGAAGAAVYPPAEAACRPLVTVPRDTVPVDGSADPKGRHITMLHSFVTLPPSEADGFAAAEDTSVYLAYTKDALYVGFRMEMAEGATPVISATKGRDTAFDDEAFVMLLSPGGEDGERFEIGGTAGGVTWERRLDLAGGWTAWNPNLRYVARTGQFDPRRGMAFWEGEFSIPWTELDAPPPRDGATWRANFFARRRTPAPRTDAWSYTGEKRDRSSYGRLVFGGDGLYFTFHYGWKLAMPSDPAHPFSLGFGVDNPCPDRPRQTQFGFQILQRQPGSANSDSFHHALGALRRQAAGEGATFAALEQDVANVLQDYEAKHGWPEGRPFPVPQDKSQPVVVFQRVQEDGDYLLTYDVRDTTDAAAPISIAAGVLPMRFGTQLNATPWPFLLTRKSIVLRAGAPSGGDQTAKCRLRGWVGRPGGKQPLAEAVASEPLSKQQDVEVSVASLPAGRYEAHLQVLGPDSKVLRDSAPAAFPIANPPEWWTNRDKLGAEPEVPEPWSAIAVSSPKVRASGTQPEIANDKSRIISVWGREMDFGDSFLPRQVTTQKKELLAAPIELELRSGGRLIPWQNRVTKMVEQRPGHVLLESMQEGAGLRVKARTRVEFDGFSLVDLTLEPTADRIPLDALDLVIPVRPEAAEFLTTYTPVPGPGVPQDFAITSPVCRFTGGTEAARRLLTRYVGRVPDHFESVVMLSLWLGRDDVGGLEWSSESSRGWSLARPAKAIEVDRRTDRIEARFHLVDHPIELNRKDAPRGIRFGLVATPVKAAPPERRRLRVDSLGYPPPVPGQASYIGVSMSHQGRWTDGPPPEQELEAWQSLHRQADVLASTCGAGWGVGAYWAWNPPVTDPRLREHRLAQMKILRESKKQCLWFGGWGVPPAWPDWVTWGREMQKWPVEPTFAQQYKPSYASPFLEYMVACFDRHARDFGIEGVRFDTVIPWWSRNPYLGETWTADDGVTYGSFNLFRQREFLKRVYRIFHGGVVSNGLVYLGFGGPPIMTVEAFTDIREVGEGFYQDAKSIREAYPPDLVRPWMTGAAYGFPTVLSNLKGPSLPAAKRIGALLVNGAEPRLTGRPNTLSPDIQRGDRKLRLGEQVWTALSWIDRATAQWWPHWKTKRPVSSAAAGEHYVSLYLQPGWRVLLIAANYAAKAQDITIRWRLDALGFSPGARLEAEDAITLEPVALTDHQTLRLTLEAEDSRLLKIAPRADLDGPPLYKLGKIQGSTVSAPGGFPAERTQVVRRGETSRERENQQPLNREP